MAEMGSKVANIGFDLITIKLLSPQTSPSLKICKIITYGLISNVCSELSADTSADASADVPARII